MVHFNIRHFHDSEFVVRNDIDQELEENITKFDTAFKINANIHSCSINGCGKCLVLDGHMKAHRKICKMANCKNDPQKSSLFCLEHAQICKIDLFGQTERKQSLDSSNSFHVEEITGKRYNNKNKCSEYKVKWLGYDEFTWESYKNIPRILVEIYKRKGSIKCDTYIVDEKLYKGQQAVLICLENEQSFWLPKIGLSVNEYAYEIEIILDDEGLESCNTKKDKIRFHRRTAGILVGGYPCGNMVFVNEIFGSESISQVASTLNSTITNNIKCIAYDDACH